MSEKDFQRIEVIKGAGRRRRWSAEQKLRIVEESFQSGDSVSVVARRYGVAPNLLLRWRRLMSEGGAAEVRVLGSKNTSTISHLACTSSVKTCRSRSVSVTLSPPTRVIAPSTATRSPASSPRMYAVVDFAVTV